MCGIAGGYGFSDENTLNHMLDSIRHRGPDESGSYFDKQGQVMMGTQRLSIVDLEGGSQPIHNEDGSVTVTFNGEIYNHLDLRETLDKEGHIFNSDSDTEILAHMWEEYGVEMTEYLNGMFAFAIWDETREQLFLARDRLGIKPLYYADTDDGLLWASEIQSLLEAGVDPALDEKAVHNYFSLRYWPWPQTPFSAIEKLPPGRSMLIDDGDCSVHQYWKLNYSKTDGSLDSLATRLRTKLESSVNRRLMSDVPIGAFLSGGLDSSAIVGIMSEHTDTDVKTFSVGFEGGSYYDESDEAEYVADYFGTDHHQLNVDLSSMDLFEDLTSYFGEPLSDPAALPTLALSRYANQEVKTVLTGEGADELFSGYWYFDKVPRHQKLFQRLPELCFKSARVASRHSPIRKNTFRYVAALENNDTSIREIARQFEMPVEEYTTLGNLETGLNEMVASTRENVDEDDFIKRMTAFDLKYWLPDNLLYKVDQMTMAASLEARVPFLDHELVEFAYGIPHRHKTGGYKPVLNRAVQDLLPDRILNREKHGFGVPVADWFRSDHSSIHTWMNEDRLSATPYLETERVFDLWRSHRRNGTDNSGVLWKVLNYTAWYHTVVRQYE